MLLSVVLAQQQWQLIVNLMALSWGVVAGCFLGPFVWGLYWRRVSAAAVSLIITPLISLVTPAPAAALVDKAFGPVGETAGAPSDGATAGTAAAAEGGSA